jgi:hypothetical protein
MTIVSALPLFFDAKRGTLTLTYFRSSGSTVVNTGQAIHLGFVVVALCFVATVLRRMKSEKAEPFAQRVVLALSACFTISMVAGQLSGAGVLGALFYAQTIIPLLAFYVAAHSGISPQQTARLITAAVLATLAFLIGLATLVGASRGSLALVNRLVVVIPQYRNYFPFLVTCALAFAIARWSADKVLNSICILAVIAFLPLMWSRTGLATLALAAALAFIMRPGRAGLTTRFLLVCVTCLASALIVRDAVASSGSVIGQRTLAGSTAAESATERLSLAGQAAGRLLAHPLLGDRFVPYSDILAGGQRAQFARLFPAHNQYLDYGLRGGVAAMLLLILLLVFFVRRSWILGRESPHPEVAAFHAGLLAILGATLVGNFTQLFVSETYPGTVLLILLGVSAACPNDRTRAGSTGQRRSPHATPSVRPSMPAVSGVRLVRTSEGGHDVGAAADTASIARETAPSVIAL